MRPSRPEEGGNRGLNPAMPVWIATQMALKDMNGVPLRWWVMKGPAPQKQGCGLKQIRRGVTEKGW